MSNLLVVVATLVAKPGHAALLKAALEQVVPPSRAEEGCSRYELHSDNEDPSRFIVLEEWRDAQALQDHEASAHFATLVQTIGGKAEVQLAKLTKII